MLTKNRILLAGMFVALLLLSACGDPSATVAPAATAAATPDKATFQKNLKDATDKLAAVGDALKKGDIEAAKTNYEAYDENWDKVEDAVKDKSKDLYKEIEDNMTALEGVLLKKDKPVAANALPLWEKLSTSFANGAKLVS